MLIAGAGALASTHVARICAAAVMMVWHFAVQLSRKMLAEMEAREFWSIQLLEEEHFTKLPVLVIERFAICC